MLRVGKGMGVLGAVVLLSLSSGYVLKGMASASRSPSKRASASKMRKPADMPMAMPLVAPLFIASEKFTSTLVLVNASGLATSADVALRSTAGTELAAQHVIFAPYSQQRVDLGGLLVSKGIGEAKGSVVVVPSPDLKGPAILAALSITYGAREEPNFLDEELAMPMPTDSQVLRGVADRGEGSPLIAVTSLSDTEQHVGIQCIGLNGVRFSKTVSLPAGGTVFTEACSERSGDALMSAAEDERNDQGRSSAGIELTSDGMPGSFAAFGLSAQQKRHTRYFSSMTFSDPQMASSSSTVFAGVPVGGVSLAGPDVRARSNAGKFLGESCSRNGTVRGDLRGRREFTERLGGDRACRECARNQT